MPDIAGYDYGTSRAAHSPVTPDELRALEASVGWTAADAAALREASRALCPRAEAMVDSWRAEIARQPRLVQWFFGPDGMPDDHYRAAVKRRFVRWVTDACTRPHDQTWLDYQEEIGPRHTPAKKNRTDGTHTPNVVPLRYLLSFAGPVVLNVRRFLDGHGFSAAEIDGMCQAWTKAVLLHIVLWSRPYVREGLW
jgi:Protoglobin